jgi:hypothetical protein
MRVLGKSASPTENLSPKIPRDSFFAALACGVRSAPGVVTLQSGKTDTEPFRTAGVVVDPVEKREQRRCRRAAGAQLLPTHRRGQPKGREGGEERDRIGAWVGRMEMEGGNGGVHVEVC